MPVTNAAPTPARAAASPSPSASRWRDIRYRSYSAITLAELPNAATLPWRSQRARAQNAETR